MVDFYGAWGPQNDTYRTWSRVTYTQNTSANQTTFTIKAYLQDRYGYGMWHGLLRNIVTVRGTQVRNSTHSISGGANASTLIATTTRTLTHSADGTLSASGVYSRLYTDGDLWLYDGTAGGNVTVPTIARATTPSSGNFTTGTATTISLPYASNAFRHDVTYKFGNATGSIGTNVANSVSWTPPESLASQIPNATSGSVVITVVTKTGSGGSVIGTKTMTKTLTLAASIVPTVSQVLWTEQNTALSTIGAFVAGRSIVRGTVTGAGVGGSTISSKSVVVNGVVGSESTNFPLPATASVPASGRVTDSRGRTGSLTANIPALPYSPPSASVLRVFRTTSANVEHDEGTRLRMQITASSASLVVGGTQKNSLYVKVYTKPHGTGESSWQLRNNLTYTSRSVNTTLTITGGDIYLASNGYDVRVDLTDNTYTGIPPVSYSFSVPTAAVTMDLNGNSVGIGKMHERGSLDVAGTIYADGDRVGGFYIPSTKDAAAPPSAYPQGVSNMSANATGWPNGWGPVLTVKSNNARAVQYNYQQAGNNYYMRAARTASGSDEWLEWTGPYATDPSDGTFTPATGWTIYTGHKPILRLDSSGVVHFNHTIQAASGASMTNLGSVPTAFRPSADTMIGIARSSNTSTIGSLYLKTNGQISSEYTNGSLAAGAYYVLTGQWTLD